MKRDRLVKLMHPAGPSTDSRNHLYFTMCQWDYQRQLENEEKMTLHCNEISSINVIFSDNI